MRNNKIFLIVSTLIITHIAKTTEMDRGATIQNTIMNEKINNIFSHEGIELSNQKIEHPIFGEMKVISHRKDIDYYNNNAMNSEDRVELVSKFVEYVVHEHSIMDDKKKKYLQNKLGSIARTVAGKNMLKSITANYMRKYDSLKQFYIDNKREIDKHHDVRKRHIELKNLLRTEDKRETYNEVKSIKSEREKIEKELLSKLPKNEGYIKHINSNCILPQLYSYFSEKEDIDKSKMKKHLMYQQLKIKTDNTERSRFYSNSVEIHLHSDEKIRKNFYITKDGRFIDTTQKNQTHFCNKVYNNELIKEKIPAEYGALLHELLHLMNYITLQNKSFISWCCVK